MLVVYSGLSESHIYRALLRHENEPCAHERTTYIRRSKSYRIPQYLSRNETDIKIDNALIDGIIHHIYLIGIHKTMKYRNLQF